VRRRRLPVEGRAVMPFGGFSPGRRASDSLSHFRRAPAIGGRHREKGCCHLLEAAYGNCKGQCLCAHYFRQPRQLFWNRGDGQFLDISSTAGPGIAARHSLRGIAVGDLDSDGSEEIVVVNLFEPPPLLKNFWSLRKRAARTGSDRIRPRRDRGACHGDTQAPQADR
jgi:FG-GAP-like repeat